MKRIPILITLLSASTLLVFGQDAEKPAAPSERRPGNPLIAALDANGDGQLDAAEINNAPNALRKLDKNHDGKVTRQEFRAAATAKTEDSADKPARKAAKKNKKAAKL